MVQKRETIMTKIKHKCARCGKVITGVIKIITYKKKVGSKIFAVVEMYDEKCFLIKNKEKSKNGNCNKKGCNKK